MSSDVQPDPTAQRQVMSAAQQHTATQIRTVLTATAAELARQHRYLVATVNQADRQLPDQSAAELADGTRAELAAALAARLDEHEHTALELLETELDALRQLARLDRN